MQSFFPLLADRVLLQAQPLEPHVALHSGLVGSQILAALIVGLLTAFGMQLLLTNLGIALGITTLAGVLRPKAVTLDASAESSIAAPKSAGFRLGMGTATGLGVLLLINTVLFVACFLATRFSQVQEPFSGAITGLVIWSAYSLLLLWLSSVAVTSLAGMIFGTTVRGFRQLLQGLVALVKGSESQASVEAAAIAAVREEVQAALNAIDIEALTASLQAVQTIVHPSALPDNAASGDPALTPIVRQVLQELLQDSSQYRAVAQQIAAEPLLLQEQVHKQLRQQTSLSESEIQQVWSELIRELTRIAELEPNDEPKPASHPPLSRTDLMQLLQTEPAGTEKAAQDTSDAAVPASLPTRLWELLRQMELKPLLTTIWQRLDLSDWEASQLWQQVQRLWSADNASRSNWGGNLVRTDLTDYLLHLPCWEFYAPDFPQQVRLVLWDPDAAPEQVQQQVQAIQASELRHILQQRHDLTEEQVQALTAQIEDVRVAVLEQLAAAVIQEATTELRQHIQDHIQDLWDSEDVSSADRVPESLRELLEHWLHQADPVRLSLFEPEVLAAWLRETPLTDEQRTQICQQIEPLYRRHWARLHDPSVYKQLVLTELQQSLSSYLRYTSVKRLTPKRIERKLKTLLEQAQVQLSQIEATLPAWDAGAFTELLRRRQSISKKQRQRILEQLQQTWEQVTLAAPPSGPTLLIEPIVEALRHLLTQGSARTPEELVSQVGQVVAASGLSTVALRQQLSQIDWQQVQRQLPEGSQTVLQIALPALQQWIWQFLRVPRRFIHRRPATLTDADHRLLTYLRYAPLTELTPERIRSNLQHLFVGTATEGRLGVQETNPEAHQQPIDQPINQPIGHLAQSQAAAEVSLDIDELTHTLTQRADLTATEVEAIAAQVVAASSTLRQEQQTANGTTDSLLEHWIHRLGQALSSKAESDSDQQRSPMLQPLLDSSPINLSQLHQSWQTAVEQVSSQGFASLEQWSDSVLMRLREQLQSFNRETGLPRQVLSSAQQGVLDQLDQLEGWRRQALRQIEQLQHDMQHRIERLKLQTQQRLEETRKAAATAAWWLFSILGSAALTSALAGVLATR
ncbi:MAG: hypothetical protein IGS38_13280 [Synechococcales cyanobacterium M58_A2018_015]|nr:hypothetical protein [Synechococcales cyanobacterium M58_A2018_015]